VRERQQRKRTETDDLFFFLGFPLLLRWLLIYSWVHEGILNVLLLRGNNLLLGNHGNVVVSVHHEWLRSHRRLRSGHVVGSRLLEHLRNDGRLLKLGGFGWLFNDNLSHFLRLLLFLSLLSSGAFSAVSATSWSKSTRKSEQSARVGKTNHLSQKKAKSDGEGPVISNSVRHDILNERIEVHHEQDERSDEMEQDEAGTKSCSSDESTEGEESQNASKNPCSEIVHGEEGESGLQHRHENDDGDGSSDHEDFVFAGNFFGGGCTMRHYCCSEKME